MMDAESAGLSICKTDAKMLRLADSASAEYMYVQSLAAASLTACQTTRAREARHVSLFPTHLQPSKQRYQPSVSGRIVQTFLQLNFSLAQAV